MTRTFIAILVLFTLALLPGCASSLPKEDATAPQTGASPSATDTGASSGQSGDASAVKGLAPSEKRAAIAGDFPAEVPAPQGVYSKVVAQSGTAWDYEVEVDAAAVDLMRWYLESYLGRSWKAVEEGRLEGEAVPGSFVVLRKGAAESRVTVYGEAQQRPTRAVVTVGVGAAVLETR